MFSSTCRSLRMPGITVLTAGCCRMCRSASSGIVMPCGTTGRSRSTRSSVGREVLGREVDVAEVSRPASATPRVSVPVRLPSSNGTRAMTAMSFSLAGGKELVLGVLIEHVVDDLHRVDEPGVERPQRRSSGCHRLMLMPIARTSPSSFSVATARCQRSSSAHVSLQTWNCCRSIVETPMFSRLFSVYSRM